MATLEQPGDGAAKIPLRRNDRLIGAQAWLRQHVATLVPFLAAGALFLLLGQPLLYWWIKEYLLPDSYYAHAPLIPFLIALMLWHRREALRAVPKAPCLLAQLVLILMLALYAYAVFLGSHSILSVAFVPIVWSTVWLVLGTRFVRVALFPLAFFMMMAPLPGPLLNDATLNIQMLSTHFAYHILRLLPFHADLQGNVITMAKYSLFVDVPCSGFKMLLSMLTFSAAFAYLVDGAPKRRIGLFLFSLPLSLVVNSVRIALIGVVGECIGANAAHTFHDWSGIITLVLGFSVLFALAKGLGCRTFAGWPIF